MATRALVGYLENGVLTSTYNHYDGYPENLGKALNQFYNTPEKAKEIANRGYISYVDPETGEIEAVNQDTPDKLDLNKMDPNQAIEAVAGLVDSYGADYAYFFTPNASTWDHIKNYGIRQMSDALEGILFGDFDNTYGDEELNEAKDVEGRTLDLLKDLKSSLKKDEYEYYDEYEKSVMRDLESNDNSRISQYKTMDFEEMKEDYNNYIMDRTDIDIDESLVHQWKFRAGIIK